MIYKEFNIQPPNSPESGDVITNVKDIVSSGMWADGAASITTFFTSSVQSGSNAAHYLDVFSANPQSDSSAKVQFSIAYGHFHGSGSVGGTGLAGNRASAGIYRQLSQTLLGPNEDKFTFAGTGAHITPNYVYAISVARQQLREKMDPGNWELHISGSNNKGIMKLIDDSGATTEAKVNQGGRVFNVVSGSIQGGTADIDTTAASQPGGGLGLFYPDLGIIILNGPVLASPMSASLSASLASNTEGGNVGKFFEKIEAANYFAARREEIITSQHFFCRIPNKEFNFSSNPSFATSSDGSFTQSTFFKNPKTFITQVGLYNDDEDLIGIAKISKAIPKSKKIPMRFYVRMDY